MTETNYYAPSRHQDSQPVGAHARGWQVSYHSAKVLRRVLQILLWVHVALQGLVAIVLLSWPAEEKLISMGDGAFELIDSYNYILFLFRLLIGAVFIATVVVGAVWWYRAYTNAEALNRSQTRHYPGWAVGYWFIPILNLFKPLLCANEMFRAADSETQIRGKTRLLLVSWWIIMIFFYVDLLDGPGTTLTNLSFVSVLIRVGIAITTILVVRTLARHQDARAKELEMLEGEH